MPVDRGRYPSDWAAISARIRARAGGRCECTGECGLHHGRRCEERNGEPAQWARGRVVLTVHHLDANPGNSDSANLRAMCQRCHLRCDTALHVRNAARTRFERRAVGPLPGMEKVAG